MNPQNSSRPVVDSNSPRMFCLSPQVFSYVATLLYFIHTILSAIRWKSFWATTELFLFSELVLKCALETDCCGSGRRSIIWISTAADLKWWGAASSGQKLVMSRYCGTCQDESPASHIKLKIIIFMVFTAVSEGFCYFVHANMRPPLMFLL